MLAGYYSEDVIAVKSGIYQVFIRYYDGAFILGFTQKAALACGSMVLYVFYVLFSPAG
jgi:hypothetical protein